jgi:hypothetical protein
LAYPHGGSQVTRQLLVTPSRVAQYPPPHAQQSRVSLNIMLIPTYGAKLTYGSATPVQSAKSASRLALSLTM